MNILLIRACKRDDYIARLCYESWKLAGFNGRIVLYSEDYKSQWFSGIDIEIIKRNYCDNFGGQIGAATMLEGFKKINFSKEDFIISCDSDIIVKINPTENIDFDFGGVGGIIELGTGRYVTEETDTRKMWHFSGQLQILNGKYLYDIIQDSSETIRDIYQKMRDDHISFADDTYMSYRMNMIKDLKIKTLNNHWQHAKYYQFEGRTDWQEIINNIQI